MKISATVKNGFQKHEVLVATENNQKELTIPGKEEGFGSSVNGGEMLFLALATCACNDVYREAAKRNMKIGLVEVSVSGEFGSEGEPGSNIIYLINIDAPQHSAEEIQELICYVDNVAEVHNTLRKGTQVILKTI